MTTRFMQQTFVLISVQLCLLSCTSRQTDSVHHDIPYPQPAPDTVAMRFLPGVVSKDSMDFNAAFSPDGKSYYFTRSENKKLIIYTSHHDGATWTEPIPVPFTEHAYSQADPAFGPDGKLYFISDRPRNEADTLNDYDIWFVSPQKEGWSALQHLAAVNTDSAEYYISFAANGNLYFASSRAGGFGQEDIYVSKLTAGEYAPPENLGATVNTKNSEYDPGISPDEDLIVFASSKRDDTFGGADLYGASRGTPAIHLGATFNTPAREFCPYFSPDSKYFFFSSERDVKWIGVDVIKRQLKR